MPELIRHGVILVGRDDAFRRRRRVFLRDHIIRRRYFDPALSFKTAARPSSSL